MKKVLVITLILISFLAAIYIIYVQVISSPDEEYHDSVVEKVETLVIEKYPDKEIVEIRPRFLDKFKDKDKRYQVAVKFKNYNWYKSFYLKNGELIESHEFR